MTLVLILGLLINAIALPIAGRRVWWLYRVITSGQPAPDRVENVTQRLGEAVKTQVVEVFGQKKLLKWSVPGAAHFFVFWAFVILATVYLEAYGSLFHPGFAIPVIGHWDLLGFAQDFIALMAFAGIVTFAVIRLRNSPERLGRGSRFSGSHLGGAWLTLLMIFNVIWSMFLFRGASVNTDNLPYGNGAFFSHLVGSLLEPLGQSTNEVLEGTGLLIHVGVMLAFLILVLHSKHLHIFLAPLNVLFGRRPVALGALKPMMSQGQPVDFTDLEEMDEDATLGIGRVEDFSWKGMLDFATCTECGRCQSQCPAWNTDKPLSPKMLILNLRDHAWAKAPYLTAADEAARAELPADVLSEAERPLVGQTEGEWAWMPEGGAVIDDDVLWSCTSCGACVEQCPVDIEHVDHIVDMRRYQVLVESNFPAELNGLFKGLENKGNPWNMSPRARLEWTQGLDVDVRVVGGDGENDPADLDEVDWLFWVGCAGAYEDRAKKTTRAVAELLDIAGIDFAVLGNGETCTGDPARRAGNEFVYQGLAAQNVETLTEAKAKKVVSTCAHCFNTLRNEYRDFGIELEVVHHTQLLNRLVQEGRLTPVTPTNEVSKRTITYHDPCYLGRHNKVYSPPRELLTVIPDAEFTEMPRNSERSFCCGAGGARMWMEENIGERVNVNRTREAVATGAEQIAVGCPFCRVMLSDGLTAEQSAGQARDEVEVLDVAQMLLASVKGESASKPAAASRPAAQQAAAPAAEATGTGPGAAAALTHDEATQAEPAAGDQTQSPDTVSATENVGPAAKASGGGSLFDVGDADGDADDTGTPGTPDVNEAGAASTATAPPTGGSLFDLGEDTTPPDPAPAPGKAGTATEESASRPSAVSDATAGSSDLGAGGSLFDLGTPDTEGGSAASTAAATDTTAEPDRPAETPAETPDPSTSQGDEPAASIPESGSLFDIADETPTPSAAESSTGQTDAGHAAAPAGDGARADDEHSTPTTSDEDQPVRSLRDIKAEFEGAPASSPSAGGPADPSAEDQPAAERPDDEEPSAAARPPATADPAAKDNQASDQDGDQASDQDGDRDGDDASHSPKGTVGDPDSLFDL